jgi:hypothetical protein
MESVAQGGSESERKDHGGSRQVDLVCSVWVPQRVTWRDGVTEWRPGR